MKFAYCPLCGEKLSPRDFGDEKDVGCCGRCGRPFFDYSAPCVLVLAENELGELAVIRQSYGDMERFVLVAGFVKENESLEDAAARELFEEIGLRTQDARYIRSYAYQKRDNLMAGFWARVKKQEFTLSGEVKTARWMTVPQAAEALKNSYVANRLLQDWIAEKRG
ncbi:MAG: NUDIX domain-containing protein [Oscillospiraceae bacterium]